MVLHIQNYVSITVCVLLVLCISNISACFGNANPRVETPLGWVEGEFGTALLGRTYCSFEGIPYAEPPIGELRFEVRQLKKNMCVSKTDFIIEIETC